VSVNIIDDAGTLHSLFGRSECNTSLITDGKAMIGKITYHAGHTTL
jgi:hypothetical protein